MFKRIFGVLIIVGLLLYVPTPRVMADCSVNTGRVSNGLVSAAYPGNPEGDFVDPNLGCIIASRAAFLSDKIPTYDDLFAKYYTLSKATNKKFSSAVETNQEFLAFEETPKVFYAEHDLKISGDPPNRPEDPKGPGVVFVGGNLIFTGDYQYGSLGASAGKAAGTVFVVKGDVIIESNVTKVDAVIIAGGRIFTAGFGCSRSSVVAAQLKINGSLISLNQSNPIAFCRTLGAQNNNTAAEAITQQPKYLSIMRNIFASTLERWSEI